MLMEQSSTSITSTGPPIQSIYTPAENVFIKLDCSGGWLFSSVCATEKILVTNQFTLQFVLSQH